MKRLLYPKPYTLKSGQALVEVLIAVSVLTVGFLGILVLLSRSISLNRVVADNHVATYLATEGIEVVKNMLDTNYLKQRPWVSGINGGNFEVSYDSTSLAPNNDRKMSFDPIAKKYGYGSAQATNFVRVVSIEPVNRGGVTEEVRVKSKVSWTTRGGGEFEVELEDRFYDWRKYAEGE